MSEPSATHPFAPFEWMLSLRYLRARRQEGFISVNAGFSFLGIMLGVATLIIVMAVMNGFRKELLDKILGLNGHLLVQPLESPLTDWEVVADRISKVPGVRLAAPIVEGQALASSPFNSGGVLVRGMRGADLAALPSIGSKIKQGTPVSHEFRFTNKGKVPLVITNVQASCGCTTPDWSKDPVPPGQQGFIKATFNAGAVGQFDKTVTVTANIENGTALLRIKGEVAPNVP